MPMAEIFGAAWCTVLGYTSVWASLGSVLKPDREDQGARSGYLRADRVIYSAPC